MLADLGVLGSTSHLYSSITLVSSPVCIVVALPIASNQSPPRSTTFHSLLLLCRSQFCWKLVSNDRKSRFLWGIVTTVAIDLLKSSDCLSDKQVGCTFGFPACDAHSTLSCSNYNVVCLEQLTSYIGGWNLTFFVMTASTTLPVTRRRGNIAVFPQCHIPNIEKLGRRG